MWWWQSQALAGALSFGGSVPLDHLTCCAAASRAPYVENAASAAPADAALSRSRRFQELAFIAPSSSDCGELNTSGRVTDYPPIARSGYYRAPTQKKEKSDGEPTRRRNRS